MSQLIPLIFSYKDDFDIKLLTKVDVPLKKEIKLSARALEKTLMVGWFLCLTAYQPL